MRWAGSARWGDFHPAFIWNFLSHCKKIVLITWLLSGKIYIFIMDSRRLQQLYFTVYSIIDMITAFSIILQLHGILLILVLIILDLSGSARRSHFEIEFGKNSKTYACALKKNLSHLARLAHLHMFIWQIFITPRWDPGKMRSHLGGLAHFSYEQVF